MPYISFQCTIQDGHISYILHELPHCKNFSVCIFPAGARTSYANSGYIFGSRTVMESLHVSPLVVVLPFQGRLINFLRSLRMQETEFQWG